MRKAIVIVAALFLAGCCTTRKGDGFVVQQDGIETYVGPPGSAWNYTLDYVNDDPNVPRLTSYGTPDARIRIKTKVKGE